MEKLVKVDIKRDNGLDPLEFQSLLMTEYIVIRQFPEPSLPLQL